MIEQIDKKKARKSETNAALYRANREKVNAASAAWKAANPERSRTSSAKSGAKYRATPKAKAAKVLRESTPEYKAAKAKYQASPEGKAVKARHDASPIVKAAIRLRMYGITQEVFDNLILVQRGLCGICGKPLILGKDSHLDHDHDTMTVRGLLCARCNLMEGKIKSLGLTPQGFADRLQRYLSNSPFSQLGQSNLPGNSQERLKITLPLPAPCLQLGQ